MISLDNFGRITDHAWKKGTTDLVRIKHGYDRVGNRTYREDIAATNVGKKFDEFYSYDGVNQLLDVQRGNLNSTKTALATKWWEENFTFDATGNWNSFKQDTDGDGTWELNQTRTHNKANELLTVSGGSPSASDANGNMTKVPKPGNWSAAFSLTYDAWNRLTTVKDGTTTVAAYSYNGLNHRVRKIVGSETRLFYFNSGWQCVEERVGTATTADMTYTWGLRYIDDLVCRDKESERLYSLADPNWNVVALCDTTGVVKERYTYSSFGKANVFDATFNTKAASNYGWTRTFTGQVLDADTVLMLYRNRYYHNALGRFMARDPFGYNTGDLSLLRYVKNRVGIYVDPLGLNEHVWSEDGYKIEVHQNDADCQISGGHGHFKQPDNLNKGGYKIGLEDGMIYDKKNKPTGIKIDKKIMGKFKKWLKCQGFVGCITLALVSFPEYVEAAQEGGVQGVGNHAVGDGIGIVGGTVIAAGAGTAVLGGTAIAGGTMTVGGTTVVSGGTIVAGVGASTVVGVGGAVVAAGAGGYLVGDAIANTRPGIWVTTNVGEGMAWVCPWCFSW